MDPEVPPPLVDKVNVVAENPLTRSCPTKNNQRKVPKRVHKAVREKLKREHLNDLFLELANALDFTHQNTGKAFILCEAIRLVKDTIAQIDCLKKENAALFSESHYVNIEKNELRDENSVLEAQIEKLQTEIKERAALYKPGLNSAPSEFQQTEVTQHCPGSSLRFPSADQALQQSSVVGPVLVVPFASDLRAYPEADAPRSISIVSKPHARYPTPGDSWPSQVLGDQPTARQKF
ncbi:transcription factor bHLH47 [Vitis riparia]|uniref:transcription factor bHLH47 n=1 Tax=Vitis riparia TaxID=96939 RepID=UPI00155AC403|nr:transcription factor bHLH47 [Vitis riparia]